ncbi:MAG: hypothetical protein AAB401_10840, partial [Acidobacteriota bacterium]
SDGKPRLDRTRKLLLQAEARIGQVFAPTTNQAIYRAILNGDEHFFINLTDRLIDRLVDALEADQTEYVVGDVRKSAR